MPRITETSLPPLREVGGAGEDGGGRTNAEMADELFISLSTTKTHLPSLSWASSAPATRVELATWAYETDRVKG